MTKRRSLSSTFDLRRLSDQGGQACRQTGLAFFVTIRQENVKNKSYTFSKQTSYIHYRLMNLDFK